MGDQQGLIDKPLLETCGVTADEAEKESNDDDDNDDDDPGEEHEFEIIDQVESEEEEGGKESGKDGQGQQKEDGNDMDDYSSSSGDDVDDSEVHAMLEKGIDKETIRKGDRLAPIIKQKIVLKEFESDPFDILPEGWVCITHNCGMPVYLHKETRVCTMARPYSLGSASARAHDIPISAIPCLQYRKQLDKEKAKLSVAEVGRNEKMPSEVSDSTESTPIDVHKTPPIAESKLPEQKSLSCPAEAKPAQHKLWMVTQESFQKCPLESQKEALHTGTGDFSSIDDCVKLMKDGAVNGSVGCPQSPGEGNIAVSLDTSSLDSSCLESASEAGKERSSAAVATEVKLHCSIGSGIPEIPYEAKLASSGSDSLPESIVSSTASILRESQHLEPGGNLKQDIDGIEEGEIVEDGSLQETGSKESSALSLVPSKPCEETSKAFVDSSFENVDQQGGVGASDGKYKSHIVREEVSSSSEPSEMVTSSSNSIANIKRKIESLKSKRGGKLRRLESGSAVGWPTENNIAVSPLKIGVGDEQSATQDASAREKLQVHAAEVKIKSAEERAKESLLDSKTVLEYCTSLFQFKTLEVKKYRSWRERRRHIEERSRRSRPELPPSTKLITCPIPSNLRSEDGGDNVKKREFILNPTGKSYLCILHEYMQRTLKIQPLYVFKELENSKTPYGATVTIGNIEYGTGYASSKKVAKQEAAKETLKVLIPDLFKKISDQEIKRNNISDLSFFDEIKVTDPRVNDLGNKVGQPSPFQLLLECLRRNFGMGNTQCDVSTKPLKNQKCEFTINVGKHSAMVVAKNKREGKQLAAQAILAKLHPHVPSWGSLLRLYGTSVQKPVQKSEEVSDVKSHSPNMSVLESLREEMRKLHRQKEAIQPKGKMVISSKHLPGKLSGVDL